MSLDFISLEAIQDFAHQYGYWAVLFGILLENAGLPLPGETIVLVGGFLAGSGELNYWVLLSSAIAGASLGGSFGYAIGYFGGWSLLLRIGQLLRVPEARLEEVKLRFSQNAPKAVFFGRFVAFLRIFAAPMAGIAGMPFLQFSFYNTVGATVWASVMVTLAYFAGQVIPLPQLAAWVGQFGLIALGAIAAWLIVPFWLESRKKQPLEPLSNQDQS